MKKLLTILAIALFSMSTTFVNAQTTKKQEITTKSAVHTKKDGTVDKRYKENKASTTVVGPTKKDGTLDKRYKTNKTTQRTTVKKRKSNN